MLRFFGFALCVLGAGHAWADGCQLRNYGTLPVEMIDFRPTTMVQINGVDTRFILDTGAFFNAMSDANASALKLDTRFAPLGFYITGVGGDSSVRIASVKDFGIVDTTLHNIQFIVGGSDAGYGLLGANLLDVVDLEIDLAAGKLTLFKTDHCDKAVLAYWVKAGGEYNVVDLEQASDSRDRRTFVRVTINGKKVRALVDSGSPATFLGLQAAKRAGIDLDAPDVKVMSPTYGVGNRMVKTWLARVDSFSVGTETIQHSQVLVIDDDFGDGETDMLLGVDFLLAHHMFIANGLRKAYFTYNGGRVFSLAAAPHDRDKSDIDLPSDDDGAAPKTADEYALLGQALLSRGEPNAAVANLNKAIEMAPDQAAFYVARANARVTIKQFDAALADLDKSLSLEPKNADALLLRAQIRLWQKDRKGAAADVTAASALVPEGSNLAGSIANLYIDLEQPASALPMLDDWIRLHSDDAMLGSILNTRCWARGLSKQMLSDALEDCRMAISRDGEKPEYLDSLGLVELRLGHYPESIKAYQQVLTKEAHSPWSLYGLGVAKIRSGETDAGKADIAAALVLDPQIEALAIKYGLAAEPSKQEK
ncbi:aspartyl protease family protein [Solimonas terrae]|uniref:aspartyl protease family protein n=1 Tax=Solimonas terrae TaxID=1396819 RepID=UPI0019D59624